VAVVAAAMEAEATATAATAEGTVAGTAEAAATAAGTAEETAEAAAGTTMPMTGATASRPLPTPRAEGTTETGPTKHPPFHPSLLGYFLLHLHQENFAAQQTEVLSRVPLVCVLSLLWMTPVPSRSLHACHPHAASTSSACRVSCDLIPIYTD
jgi:hypothetical protein